MLWINKVVRRLVMSAITVAVGGFLAVTLARYAPGFDVDERQLNPRLSRESLAAIHRESDEQRNVVSYYVTACKHVLYGDLGTSRILQRPVRQLVVERGIVTLKLISTALAIAWLSAISFFAIAWLSRSPGLQVVGDIGSCALFCLPSGAIALLLVMLNGPTCIALALVVSPKVFRYLSGLARSAAGMPHILTAQAKGATRTAVLLWHVVPVIRREIFALAGVSVGLAISGAIPVEALCGSPGLGQLAWQSALARDLPVLTSVSLLVVASTVLANSGADLLSAEKASR
jgi:peptide/nickel transport system permease protein